AITAKGLKLSGSFLVLVLAMAFLGPAPAVALGVATMLFAGSRRMPALPLFLNNLATYAVFPLVGGLMVRWGRAHGLADAVAVFAFQWLTRALLKSEERAEQLAVKTTQLASLQVGVLTALVQTLSLRDKMTARHSAAVARYARAIAQEIGCSPEEQELVHT